MRLDRVSQIDLYFDGQGRLNVEIWDWESDCGGRSRLTRTARYGVGGAALCRAGNAVNVRVSSTIRSFHLVDYVV